MKSKKLTMAVHKFTSCDGCQLAFLNLGETLIELVKVVDIVHFPELGPVAPDAKVDIAFVEGSISTLAEKTRITQIRKNTKFLITIGACATAGGIQALRNFNDKDIWVQAIYAKPATISALKNSTAIANHVKVDLELWGCPVNSKQVMDAVKTLMQYTAPSVQRDSVCMECKRLGNICVMVSQGTACMGPITQTGCGALCPSVNRDCYACYGPSENPNTESFIQHLQKLGLSNEAIKRRFLFITSQAEPFKSATNTLMTPKQNEEENDGKK